MSGMLKALYLESTDETPKVILDADKNQFWFEGRCIPEDGIEFFMPIMNWMSLYGKNPRPETNIDIKLSYFNSASSKAMWEFFSLLRKFENTHAIIKWHYSEEDDEMRDAGEEFASFFSLEFDYIPYEDEHNDDDDDFLF